jgi:hypothetical protein
MDDCLLLFELPAGFGFFGSGMSKNSAKRVFSIGRHPQRKCHQIQMIPGIKMNDADKLNLSQKKPDLESGTAALLSKPVLRTFPHSFDRTIAELDPNNIKYSGQLNNAVRKLLEEFYAGLAHGFFEYEITCEIINANKRRLNIKAGKTFQFIIPVEDLLKTTPEMGGQK